MRSSYVFIPRVKLIFIPSVCYLQPSLVDVLFFGFRPRCCSSQSLCLPKCQRGGREQVCFLHSITDLPLLVANEFRSVGCASWYATFPPQWNSPLTLSQVKTQERSAARDDRSAHDAKKEVWTVSTSQSSGAGLEPTGSLPSRVKRPRYCAVSQRPGQSTPGDSSPKNPVSNPPK